MARKKKPLPLVEQVEITDIAAEGKSIARLNFPNQEGGENRQMVVFVPWTVPGDVVDIQIRRKKHNYAEAEVVKFHKYSDLRTTPRCKHFGTCGGCKWQNLPYDEQLKAKQQQVYDQLTRLGHLDIPKPGTKSEKIEFRTIIGSNQTYYYRNKLDFSCANKRYLTKQEIAQLPSKTENLYDDILISAKNNPAIGFHVTGAFDKVLPIEECHLMDNLHNEIRNFIYSYSINNNIEFYDVRNQTGLLRDVIFRNSNTGQWMLIFQFKFDGDDNNQQKALRLMQQVADNYPQISSIVYVDNQKCNDTFGDLPINILKGKEFIVCRMEDLNFNVGAKSFYQTNTEQAYQLYSVVRELALHSDETTDGHLPLIYDLYTGTGTIANFMAKKAKKVIGIEYVPEAIEDAKINSEINNINNTSFFAGDMKDILCDDFITEHGNPDIIITDPPRAGMHPDVVNTILRAQPRRIVYVSCNPATQARDLSCLTESYEIKIIQPVDMFPHTPHIENVVLLERKE